MEHYLTQKYFGQSVHYVVSELKEIYPDIEFVSLHKNVGASYDFCYDRYRIRYDSDYKVICVVQG